MKKKCGMFLKKLLTMESKKKKEILDKLSKTTQINQIDITEKLNEIHNDIDKNKISEKLNFLIIESVNIDNQLSII